MAATTACNKANAEIAAVAEHGLQLYSNLIKEKARQLWTKIVAERIDAIFSF